MKKLMQSNMHINRAAKLGRTELGLFVMHSDNARISQKGFFSRRK